MIDKQINIKSSSENVNEKPYVTPSQNIINFQLPPDFNEEVYYKLNPDVKEVNNIMPEFTASFHYVHFGFKENRSYKIEIPPDFNEEVYYKLNPDVKEIHNIMPEFTATYHYQHFGFKENRRYKIETPTDFVEEVYYKLNPDVKEINNIMPEFTASYHYQHFGFNENRCYKIEIPPDFNEEVYYKLNPDVKEINNIMPEFTATYHYQHFGFNENRNYKIEFPNYFNDNLWLKKEPNTSIENVNYDFCNYITDLDLFITIPFIDKNNNKNIFLNKKNFKKETLYYYFKYYYPLVKVDENPKNLINIHLINNILSKSFILFIDEYLNEETSIFLKMIIKKYSCTQTFLIARSKENIVQFTINNDYLIHFTLEDSIQFMEVNKNNITKIFINHLIGHSNKFINKLFSINKEVTLLSHDYYYLNINKNSSSFLFKNYNINNIIFTNENSINYTQDYLSFHQNITFSDLPDFKYSLEKKITQNKNIVVGIIGSLTIKNGINVVDFLVKYIQFYKLDIKVVVFGKCSNNFFDNIFPFNNIKELNDLLLEHKPNVLLETSLLLETFSYDLSLAILTQLPILSLEKTYENDIKYRLSLYKKVNYFSNIKELINLIKKVKQNFFFTVSTTVSFNSFWEKYFDPLYSIKNL